MSVLDRVSEFLNHVLAWVAGAFLAGIVVLTCANIFLRIIWKPVMGTVELIGYAGAIVTGFALGYTHIKGGHIAVDLLVQRFSKRTRKILGSLNSFICTIFFAMVSLQIAKYATTLLKTGEVTETLRIIYYPFTYGVALGCALLALVCLTNFLMSVLGKEEAEE
jgi:TRAP-type C4-dicarboxylate transport system permease small subunit